MHFIILNVNYTAYFFTMQDLCKMTTEAISSGQTSVQAELRRTANTREYFKYQVVVHIQLKANL